MVVLGLGSNVGDRLTNLRNAYHALKQLNQITIQQISPVYVSDALLPENAPPEWDMPHLNLAIRIDTVFTPIELLDELKKIENKLGRKPAIRHWGPRVVDIDILAWDQQMICSERLTVPHANLTERPFALWPLADVAPFWRFPLEGIYHGKTAAEIVEQWGSRFTGDALLHTKQINQRIDTPQLVGILNITPDSFSDGGEYQTTMQAFAQVKQLIVDGAEFIDIGAEATSPNATPISPETEWQRLQPILEMIHTHAAQFFLKPKISIDTRHVATAEKACAFDIAWINDVSGLTNPDMRAFIRNHSVDCVMMHSVSLPAHHAKRMSREQDVIDQLMTWFDQQLIEIKHSGIDLQRIIIDPGIGFGKHPEQSLQLIKQINVFQKFGVRILLGHSRKLFLSLLTDKSFPERDIETATIALYLREKVNYLRVHNVEMCARMFRMLQALM